MMLKRIFICYFLMLECLLCVLAVYGAGKNLTNFLRHRRKRTLIFNDSGSTKLIIGPVYPLELDDPINWRSFLCLYNIHVGNYNLPSRPLYSWNKWETFYARSHQKQIYLQPDKSREFLYLALENFMNTKHGNGRYCLLRAICENIQINHYMDLFSEILNVILTPGRGDADPIYGHAYAMGKAGADCLQYYNKCPQGLSFLDQLLLHTN